MPPLTTDPIKSIEVVDAVSMHIHQRMSNPMGITRASWKATAVDAEMIAEIARAQIELYEEATTPKRKSRP